MKSILTYAKILNENDAPAVGITINLETYILSSRRWVRIGAGKTNAQGYWSLNVVRNTPNEVYAPMLRLVLPGSPVPKVLGRHAMLRYDAVKKILTADFGVVELLENETYKLTAANATFRRTNYYVTGQPHQPPQIRAATAMRLNTHAVRADSRPTAVNREVSLAADERAELRKLKGSEIELKSRISEKDQLLSSREVELKRVRKSESELKSKIASKDNLLNSKEKELKQFRGSLAVKESQLGQKDQELVKANKRIADLMVELSDKDKVVRDMRADNKVAPVAIRRHTPINKIAANIGSEVDSANRALVKQNLPYKFGRIGINIKGAVGKDGTSIALADSVDSAKSGAISEVNMELVPTQEPVGAGDIAVVPDVVGLTEGVVRRILHSLGLKLDVINKSTKDGSTPIGQSIQQTPLPGVETTRNSTVLVVFAAP